MARVSDEELWSSLLKRVNATELQVKAAVLSAATRSLAQGNRDYGNAAEIVTWLYPWLQWTLCRTLREKSAADSVGPPSNFAGYCFVTALRKLTEDRDDAGVIAARRHKAGQPVVTYEDPASLPRPAAASRRLFASFEELDDSTAEELEQILGSFDEMRLLLSGYEPQSDIKIFQLRYFEKPRKTDVEVAAALGISKNTVGNRMKVLFRALLRRLVKKFGLDSNDDGQVRGEN